MSDEASTAVAPVTPVTQATPAAPLATQAAPQTQSSGIADPWQKDFITSDFSLNHKALERLPDHLKGMRPTLEKYKSLEDVLTGFQNQQVMAGKKALAPLPADAPATAIAERRALLATINGVPAEPKGYGVTKPADLPDNLWGKGAQEMADNIQNLAHKHAISPSFIKELVAANGTALKTQLAEQAQEEKNFWAKEQQTFEGIAKQSNIPLDRASALVEKGAQALGLDMANERTKRFLQGSEARLMAMRHAIAIGEDKAVTGNSGGMEGGDPSSLARDLRTNPANPQFAAYWNKDGKYSRADHDAAVERHNGWLRMAEEKAAKR